MSLDLHLDPRQFAVAWTNTALFTSDDESRPALYRTALAHATTTGLTLTTTDSYTSATARAHTEKHAGDLPNQVPPGRDLGTFLVADHDRRLHALCQFILKDAKGDNRQFCPPVRLWVKSAETPEVPTLMPEMDRQEMVITYRSEAVGLPILETEFPDIAALVDGIVGDEVGAVSLSAEIMGRFGKMKDVGGPVRCVFSGPITPVRWQVPGDPGTEGIWMPVRDAATDKAVDVEEAA